MGRPRKTSMEVLEKQIQDASEAVIIAKRKYDQKTKALSDLINKKNALEREILVDAIQKSKHSYEEIMAFITSDCMEED